MVSVPAEHYDAIVIGAGQSGGPLTSALTANGMKTALIERAKVGGSCVNWGCTPTKTMVGSARVAHLVSRAADYGVNAGNVDVDLAIVRQRKRDIVDMFHGGTKDAIESTNGLDLIKGEATFTGEKQIRVSLTGGGTRDLAAEKIFINTGLEPSIPPIDGLDDVPYLTSSSIMELGEVPEHLIIAGGGYIGLEFGQMFRRFGAQITILGRSDRLLSREDPDVSEELRNVLEEEGIVVHTNTSLQAVGCDGNGRIKATADRKGRELNITGSHLLMATGRKPAARVLDIEKTGIELDEDGFIPVNDRLETSVPGIWAIGDVKGGPAFTHISYDDYRILTENLFDEGGASIKDRIPSYVVFIDPELARVGMNELEAKEAGHDIQTASITMDSVARALETDETRGMMKAVIDAKTGRILGATIFGISGGEIMSILQLAMITGTPYTTLRDAPFAHPTVAESLNNLFSNVE
jgi:pyruvate/2-oxoglutarate dehydrogenase complex dihydrolipoamide dehydrogenase (E3) component